MFMASSNARVRPSVGVRVSSDGFAALMHDFGILRVDRKSKYDLLSGIKSCGHRAENLDVADKVKVVSLRFCSRRNHSSTISDGEQSHSSGNQRVALALHPVDLSKRSNCRDFQHLRPNGLDDTG